MARVDKDARRAYEQQYRAENRERRNAECRAHCRRQYADPVKRAAILEKNRAWRAANPGRIKERDLRRFNLTVADYERMVVKQAGRCDICGEPETRTVRGKLTALAIDHDQSCCPGRSNSCGRCVRGLLCYHCNTAIGLFNDSYEMLESAMFYLVKGEMKKETTVGA